jgi:CHAT domain-containing protein/tetratricopeptide (TPR) repeat protein
VDLTARVARGSSRRGAAWAAPLVCFALLAMAGPAQGAEAPTPPTAVPADSIRALIDRFAFREAEAAARARLAVDDAAGRADTATARVIDLLVEVQLRAGRYRDPEALASSDRAIGLKEKLYGRDHLEVARSLAMRATLLSYAGEPAAARPHAERALGIRLAALGPDHPETATMDALLATLDMDEEHYARAAEGYRRALRVFERSVGPESRPVGQMLHNLGMVHRRTGEYVQAKEDYERALAVREKVLGPDHPDVAWTLNNLANVLYELGDYQAVARTHRRALAIREKVLGPDHPDVANSLVNLGNVLVILGDSTAARAMYQRALTIQERTVGPEHADVARTLNNLALLVAAGGDLRSAQSMYERSARIREAVFGPTHSETALTLVRLARLYEQTGDDSLALATNARAVELRRRGYGDDHPLTGEAMAGYASALARLGRDSLALDYALRADRVAIDHFRLTARSLEDRAAELFGGVRTSSREVAITLAVQPEGDRPRLAGAACDAQIRARALVLDELAERQRAIAESGDPEVERLAAEVLAARERLAELVVRGVATGDSSGRQRLAEAQGLRDRTERALAERSARFRTLQQTARIGLPEVRAALPRGVALVAYARYERVEPWPRGADGRRTIRPERPYYAAFVVRGDLAEPAVVDLGPADALEARAARWLALVARRPAPASAPRREHQGRLVGDSLRATLWDPVAARLGGVARVLVVPDGAVHQIPLGALPTSPGRYLIEDRPTLHLLSTERDVVTLAAPRPLGTGLLAFGAPDFERSAPAATAPVGPSGVRPDTLVPDRERRGGVSGCADFASLRFAPLPGTADEVTDAQACWRHSAGFDTAVVRTGAAATEGAFKQLARGRRVLHLATHGFFLSTDCGGGERRPGGAEMAAEARENPLLRSGVALAGANRRASRPGADDGIVTAEEIAALDLRGVEWAVLSACQTGAGEFRAGEGLLGLRRAFQIAGVRTVVMSLWSVDDESTRGWMAALCRARAGGAETLDAVTAASVERLRERRARGRGTLPYYWAPFVASGDWR